MFGKVQPPMRPVMQESTSLMLLDALPSTVRPLSLTVSESFNLSRAVAST